MEIVSLGLGEEHWAGRAQKTHRRSHPVREPYETALFVIPANPVLRLSKERESVRNV
jgi:hypothetical protein